MDGPGEQAQVEGAEGSPGASQVIGGGSWWARLKLPALIFAVSFGVLCALAWDRVGGPSTDPHFAYQANAWLAGSLELQKPPPHGNDWASYEWMVLRSGQEVRGIWLDRAARRFKALDGSVMIIEDREVDPARRGRRTFMSFPPGPAVLMLPLAAIWGYDVNDVLMTIFFGALNVALMFLLLRRLAESGLTRRTRSDNLWLTLLFGAGTVHLWCAVLGQVWFTALVIGATFTLLYMLASIDARRPLLAGLALAAAFSTRTPLLFSAVFFLGFALFPGGTPVWRRPWREGWRPALGRLAWFAAPCALAGVALLIMNQLRFESWTEFGHTYLAGGRIARIQQYGLFDLHFLARNLTAALTLLPEFKDSSPYIQISRHGMSLLVTTPAWAYLLWPRPRRDARERQWFRLLWLTVAAIGLPALFYQNTGYEQFGYRFSLDYTPYLVALLALGLERLSPTFKALVLWGVAVNTFGAIVFKRFDAFFMRGGAFWS